MSKKEKAIAKLRQNPRNVRFDELRGILLYLGFEERQGKGSHVVFTLGSHILTVPVQNAFLKPFYIKLALQKIDEILELEE